VNPLTELAIDKISKFSGESTEMILQRLVLQEYERYKNTPSAIYKIEDM